MRQRGGGGGRGVRLRLGGGLRGGVLLAAEDQVQAPGEALHPQAQEGLQSNTGKKMCQFWTHQQKCGV